jgi:hypothetical protein
VPPEELAAAARAAPRFARRSRLGYVVVDRTRASQELVDLVLKSLDLDKVGESWPFDLYRVRPTVPEQLAAAGDSAR